ncbi:MAG: hypothetical protein QXT13_12275, partial [Pyrobaculum sp.]
CSCKIKSEVQIAGSLGSIEGGFLLFEVKIAPNNLPRWVKNHDFVIEESIGRVGIRTSTSHGTWTIFPVVLIGQVGGVVIMNCPLIHPPFIAI